MAFMEPIYEQGVFGRIEDKHGETRLVPIGYVELEDGETCEEVTGWFCRLSANGYMDQTDWDGPFETEQEARDHIAGAYDIDPDTGDELGSDA